MSNVQYPTQVITLVDGILVGYHKDPGAANQEWSIVAVGEERYAFQNPPTGLYATVVSEHQGAKIVGGFDPYVLQIIPVRDGFQIATGDGRYIWRLTAPEDYSPIELQATPYDGKDAVWTDLGPAARVE